MCMVMVFHPLGWANLGPKWWMFGAGAACYVLTVGRSRTIFLCFAFYQLLTNVDDDDNDTYMEFWTAFAWSLAVLYTGKWPKYDWKKKLIDPLSQYGRLAEQQLAGGWFATVWAALGDLDYFRQQLHMRSHSSNELCSWCPADSTIGSMTWSDVRMGLAAWLNHVHTPAQFLAHLKSH